MEQEELAKKLQNLLSKLSDANINDFFTYTRAEVDALEKAIGMLEQHEKAERQIEAIMRTERYGDAKNKRCRSSEESQGYVRACEDILKIIRGN